MHYNRTSTPMTNEFLYLCLTRCIKKNHILFEREREPNMNTMAQTENVTKKLHFHVFNCEMYQNSKCHALHFDQMCVNGFVSTCLSLCSTVFSLSQYQSELCELSQLAWRGLESNQTLFREGDISPDVLNFALRTGFFSQVSHCCMLCVWGWGG